jgi:hypothetical protein
VLWASGGRGKLTSGARSSATPGEGEGVRRGCIRRWAKPAELGRVVRGKKGERERGQLWWAAMACRLHGWLGLVALRGFRG